MVTCCGCVGPEDSDLEEVAARSSLGLWERLGKAKTTKQAL